MLVRQGSSGKAVCFLFLQQDSLECVLHHNDFLDDPTTI